MRVAIIPARGGSVRLPRKNIREFRGRPVIAYPICAARDSRLFDQIIVSTDDAEIADAAAGLRADIAWRERDDGQRGTQDVARELLCSHRNATQACVIYPCSPLLEPTDLILGYLQLQRSDVMFAMSVQQEPLADAGCYYFGWADGFRQRLPLIAAHTAMVPLPPERVCDINTQEDWDRAEFLYDALRRAS